MKKGLPFSRTLSSSFRVANLFVCNRSGNVAILFALMMPVLLGFLGIGVEAGYWYFKNRQLQTAADLASFAGATSLRAGESSSQARDAAIAEAISNGYDPTVGTIVVNNPPQSGNFTGNAAVEVLIQSEIQRMFSRIFDRQNIVTNLRAVATYEDGGTGCIIALNPTAHDAVNFSGSANASLIACEVMSNSVAADSVAIEGSADVDAPCVNAVGGVSATSNLVMTDCPEARENLPPIDDPYAHLSEPDMSAPCEPAGSTAPGRHCGGLDLTGSVHLAPGTYIVDGGSLKSNASANITGDGVTFFITNGADVRFNGSSHLDLSAPTTGDYAGVLMYGDPDSTTSSVKLNGNASSNFTGSFYMPSQTVEHLGNFGATNGCTQIIADKVEISGSSAFGADCTGTGVVTPKIPGKVKLVE